MQHRKLIMIQKECHVGNDTQSQQLRFYIPRIVLMNGKAAMKVPTSIQSLGQG